MSIVAPFGRSSCRALVSLVLGVLAVPSLAVVTLGPGNTITGGINLNAFVGATAFYGAGYTGARATLANIEGGYSQTDGLATGTKGVVTFRGTGALPYAFSLSATSSVQPHATWVSAMMAGYSPAYAGDPAYGPALTGIAYGARLWSGNIALSADATSGSFSTSDDAIWSAYNQAMRIGVGTNGTADVINSSWGPNGNTELSASGATIRSAALDYLVQKSHKLVCFSAGNSAYDYATHSPVTGLAAQPGDVNAGFNTLTVGSLGSNIPASASASFTGRSVFSSYGPSNYYDPNTGTVIANVRASVDIAAPGEAVVSEDKHTATAYSFAAGDGTSFSSPIVAGVAGLLVDAAKDRGYASAADSRVLASILMTGADKNVGWTNNASVVGGVSVTTQGLDWETGAGRLNGAKALSILTDGTTDVPGLGGGFVRALGWDLGSVSAAASTDYALGELAVGSTFTSTLRWDAAMDVSATDTTISGAFYDYLSDLRLELYNGANLVAYSDSAYNNTEHLNFLVGGPGLYTMRVRFMGENYDFVNHANSESYGLAWSGTAAPVPEPASLAALGLGALAVLRRHRCA